jgi:hypothetical protein
MSTGVSQRPTNFAQTLFIIKKNRIDRKILTTDYAFNSPEVFITDGRYKKYKILSFVKNVEKKKKKRTLKEERLYRLLLDTKVWISYNGKYTITKNLMKRQCEKTPNLFHLPSMMDIKEESSNLILEYTGVDLNTSNTHFFVIEYYISNEPKKGIKISVKFKWIPCKSNVFLKIKN